MTRSCELKNKRFITKIIISDYLLVEYILNALSPCKSQISIYRVCSLEINDMGSSIPIITFVIVSLLHHLNKTLHSHNFYFYD